MPIFRLNRAFGVGRGIKVFFDIHGGATRGALPDAKHIAELGKTVEEQRELLEKKDRQIEHSRQRFRDKRGALQRERLENLRLRNELDAKNGAGPDAREVGALPDFVIVGAQKCGTTRLYNLLSRHPNVEPGATKEMHFFDRRKNFEKGVGWYRGLFAKPGWKDGHRSITGEKTPSYLFHPRVPKRMAEAMPEVLLIALLRNPVDRAYSHYHHLARRGRERRSFEEAVDAELAELAERGEGPPGGARRTGRGPRAGPLARGIYVDQLARWRRFFDEEQMLVLRSEDFFDDAAKTLERVQNFLDLPHRELAVQSRTARSRYEPLDPALRQRLEAFFEPHNRRLYDLLGRDLGW